MRDIMAKKEAPPKPKDRAAELLRNPHLIPGYTVLEFVNPQVAKRVLARLTEKPQNGLTGSSD